MCIRDRTQTYSGVYEGVFVGSAEFGGKTVGQFEGLVSKSYLKTYEGAFNKQYEGSFTGNYIKQFDFSYIKHYQAQYSKLFEGSFTGYFSKQYEGVFTQQFEGTFGIQYNKLWSQLFEGNYQKIYNKVYGGVYQGTTGSFSGTANYIGGYAGIPSYVKAYAGTTTAANTKTGEITDEGGVTRIKSGGAFKQVETVKIKEDGVWKDVLVTRVKEDGEWKTVNVSYERTDVTLNSNTANFNLLTHLTNAGKSTGSRAQLVNITVSNCYVYSANTVAALDIGNLSAVGGIPHRVRILVKDDGNIVGMSGTAGAVGNNTSVGTDGGNGGDAIKTKDGVELYIENYGTIAGGGGGGGLSLIHI